MVGLIARIFLAVAGLAGAIIYGKPAIGSVVQLATALVGMAVFAYLLERRDMKNAGTGAFLALADSAMIAAGVAMMNRTEQFGFLVLAPCAYAAAKHGSNPAAMAPIAASMMLAAANIASGAFPSSTILMQAVAVLGIGLLLNQARIIMTVTEEVIREVQRPVEAVATGPTPQSYLVLRENFRRLKEHTQQLDRVSRKARYSHALHETVHARGERLPQALANRLREMVAVDGVTIHVMAQSADTLVVSATSGQLPDHLTTSAVDLTQAVSEIQIRQRIEQAFRIGREDSSDTRTVIMRHRDAVVGLITLSDRQPGRLEEGLARAQEAAPSLAAILADDHRMDRLERRLKEAELLYAVSSVGSGADTSTGLASRVVRELGSVLQCDHLSMFFLDGTAPILVAAEGARHQVFEALSMGGEIGIAGWIAAKAPELAMFDATDDPRMPRVEALKRRVGSLMLVPIRFDEEPFGFMMATTHRVGGLDGSDMETLRCVGAELSQAIGRLETTASSSEGLMAPREFQQKIKEVGNGVLVYLEPIRRDWLIEEYGTPAYETATRQLARRLRAQLPQGGFICRRSEGDFVVFLPKMSEGFASSWANGIVAISSMISISTPDGRGKMPLGLKAKVAAASGSFSAV